MKVLPFWMLLLFGLLVGCPVADDDDAGDDDAGDDDSGDDDSGDDDAGDDDAGDDDSGDDDAGDDDSGDDDSGDDDAGDDDTAPTLPLPGWGTVTGDCDELDTELTSPDPWLFDNVLDLAMLGFDYAALTAGGQEIWDEGNLGGSSIHSEIIAFEILARCELAGLLKTEAEIDYLDPSGKKTDLLVTLDGLTIGVSVTRAFGWPPEDPWTVEQATDLLEDKLDDILVSTANVAPADAWTKQILSVVAYTPDHAAAVATAWASLDAATRADTIVFVTATEGDDAFVY